MAKLTKQTVAAVSKGKKETVVAKPKTGPKATPKVTAKPAAKKPVKPAIPSRRATAKPKATAPKTTPKAAKPAGATTGVTLAKITDITAKPVTKAKPVKSPKVLLKVEAPKTLLEKDKKKPRKPRSFRTDTSKFRKYNNELRINLRNLIYDKGYTIAKVAREMGILPHYLFNVLKLNKTSEGGNDAVVVLDIVYAVCSVIGVNISSVLPEAEIVNPIYKTKTDVTDKVNELQEENVKLNFLFTQTKQQLDTQSVKLAASEARIKELENFLESSFNKIGKIRERLANISKLEESKS
jgi:hypothetical protein|nr:MAG TPA: structural protein [Caudoviricetes sp.]